MAFRHEARRGHTHTASSGDVTVALDDLSDVTITSVASNDLIQYNGSAWVNIPASTVIGTVDHGALSGLSDDDHPQYGHLSQDETVLGHWTFTDNIKISGPISHIRWIDTNGVTDANKWFLGTTLPNKMIWELRSDDEATSTPFMEITRATTTADKIDFRNLTDINLDLGLAISWEGSDAVDYEYLVVEGAVATLDSDEYLSLTKVTSTSTSFVTVTGATLDVSTLTDAEVYLVVAAAHVGNISSGAAASNGVQVTGPAGTALSGSVQTFESTGFSSGNADNFGDPYGYMGWFTNDTGGSDIALQYKKASTGTSVFANRIGMFVLNLTDLPNHSKIESIADVVLDGSDEGTTVATAATLTLAADDWIIFTGVTFGNFSGGASNFEYVVDDGTTVWKQSGGFVQDSATDEWVTHGVIVLDSYAGGTVTIRGHIYGGVNGADIRRAAIVAIPLSDFTEAAWSQNASTTPALDDGTGNNTVCETVNIASVTNAGSWMVLGWGCTKDHGGTPWMGFDTQENVNSGGASTIGGGLAHKINLGGGGEGYWCDMCIAGSLRTYAASDQVTLTTRYDVNGTTGNWSFLHEGLVAVFMQAGSADTLYVGHASHGPTIVQGTSTNVTSAATDIDGTLHVDGAATLQSTLNTVGAVDFDSTLNVDGNATFGGSVSIFDATDTDSGAFSHDGTDLNLTLTTTTDWNLVGGTGVIFNDAYIQQGDHGSACAVRIDRDDGSIQIRPTATTGGWARGFVTVADSTSTRLGGAGFFGSNETLTSYHIGIGATWWSTDEVFQANSTYVGIRNGKPFRVYASGGVDYFQIDADGTDINLTANSVVDVNLLATGKRLLLPSTSDAGLATTTHPFQIGTDASTNLRLDMNEIMAVNNGAASTLYVNADGGTVNFGFNTACNVEVDNGATFRVYDSLSTDYIQLAATSTVTTISSTQHIELTPAASHYVSVFRSGSTIDFRVYDGGGTDYAAFNHNGTNFNVALTNTTSMAFSGVTASYTFDKQLHVSTTGSQIKIQETDAADPADYWLAEMDGSNLNFYFRDNSAAAFILPLRLDALNKSITVRDGCSFTIYNSGMTDFGSFAHDGTDFNLTPSNTTAFRLKSGLDFAINSDDNGTSSIYFTPGATSGSACTISGTGATHFTTTYVRAPYLQITDGVTAPGTVSGQAQIYVDTSDGDLKVIFGDGTVKTIVVDT